MRLCIEPAVICIGLSLLVQTYWLLLTGPRPCAALSHAVQTLIEWLCNPKVCSTTFSVQEGVAKVLVQCRVCTRRLPVEKSTVVVSLPAFASNSDHRARLNASVEPG